MTDDEFEEYVARLNAIESNAALIDLERELARLPESDSRTRLIAMARKVRVQRARESDAPN